MIQPFIDQLVAGLPAFTVAEAPRGGDLVALAARATGEQLVTLLATVTPGNVSAITADDAGALPYSVYELVGGSVVPVDGAVLATEITYVVTLHASSYPDLADLIDAAAQAITLDSGFIEITDIAHVSKERPTGSYSAALALSITRPVVDPGDEPLLLVWQVRSDAQPEQDMLDQYQRVDHTIGVALLTDGDLVAERQSVQDVLLGWQPAAEYFPTAYASGVRLPLGGGLAGWHETYRSSVFINEP